MGPGRKRGFRYGLGRRESAGLGAVVPDFVTHYHLPDRRPFLNLSDLDAGRQTQVMRELLELRAQGRQFRPFGRAYVAIRQRTEARLRDLFIARGGRPERLAPHYFVLGHSTWYEQLAPDMCSVRVPVCELPPEQTSITYPDSFLAVEGTALDGIASDGGDPTLQRHQRQVYLLDELESLVADTGIPQPEWRPEHAVDWTTWPPAAWIEVQVWTDTPIAAWLGV